MTDKEAMQMALETLDNMVKVDWREWDEFASVGDFVRWAKSRASFTAEALRARLAQPEQEPVAWISHNAGLYHGKPDESLKPLPLYTAPPQREWVGLTDEEVDDIGCDFATLGGDIDAKDWFAFYLSIEAKLKEKNN